MKKLSILMLGIIIGAALAITSSAYADDIKSLIGKTIQGEFPVKIEGKELSKKALVIDGTSYVPLRAFGDAIGYDSTFDAELGITFKLSEAKKMGIQKTTDEYKLEAKAEEEKVNAKITAWNVESDRLLKEDRQKKDALGSIIGQVHAKIINKRIDIDDIIRIDPQTKETEDALIKANVELVDLQKQYDDLQKQSQELNAQPIPTPTPTP